MFRHDDDVFLDVIILDAYAEAQIENKIDVIMKETQLKKVWRKYGENYCECCVSVNILEITMPRHNNLNDRRAGWHHIPYARRPEKPS